MNKINNDMINLIVDTFDQAVMIYYDAIINEQLEDKRDIQDINSKMALTNAINDLSQREQDILDKRYIIGKTQMEIANELGISQAQVSRIEKGAIKTLKKVLR